jgi:hypothetical protein
MTNARRSLDLTESDWGLRKKTQRQTYRETWDGVGLTLLMGDTLQLQVHLFKQHVWESGANCRSSSHGSSSGIGSRNSTAVVCCYLLQTMLTRSACPVFLARQPCWTLPPLGRVHAYQPRGPLTESCSCQGPLPLLQSPLLQGCLAEPCSPPLCGVLPSQVKVSSQNI